MHRLLAKLTMAATATVVGGLVLSNATVAQVLPPASKPARVEILKGPALEIARDDMAIIRWTTNNPGGTDDRFAVVHYGTDPKDLSQTAKSPIRLNRQHTETIFRVRMIGLKPRTTYFYKVSSTESNGKPDAVTSPVKQFTTPGPGERITGPTVRPPSASPPADSARSRPGYR